jgi:ATP-dependent exoDNAse (exonuclease V) beta subunit
VFDLAHDSIKVMTLHVSNGLGFLVVALVVAGRNARRRRRLA